MAEHGDLVLTSADGTEFGAYHAQPGTESTRGFVILPDVRGLHGFYKDLAHRFAEAGMHTVALDYFGRTAGIGERGEDFPFREHVDKLDRARLDEDVAAAAGWLRANTSATSVFTVGFCMGGAHSWRQAATDTGFAGCVGFYGIPSRVTDVIGRISAPLLILAAGQDFTPVEEVERFADQVRATGNRVDMAVYPNAPHSYFDRTFGEHADACADSWRQILDFVESTVREAA